MANPSRRLRVDGRAFLSMRKAHIGAMPIDLSSLLLLVKLHCWSHCQVMGARTTEYHLKLRNIDVKYLNVNDGQDGVKRQGSFQVIFVLQ